MTTGRAKPCTPMVKRIIAILKAHKIEWPFGADVTYIRRTRAGVNLLSMGALSWTLEPACDEIPDRIRVGSLWPATQLKGGRAIPPDGGLALSTVDYLIIPK